MRRSPLSRAAATLVSLLFLLAWSEPAALHPCPMHDGHPAAADAHDGESAQPASTVASAIHHEHDAMASAATAPAAPLHDAASHTCQCLGHCCSASGVVLAPVQLVRWQAVVTRRAEPPALVATAIALVASPHVLPFANAPPRLT